MSITMRELLQVEELQSAVVLAGADGLDKAVCRIATIEKPFVDHPDYCYRVAQPHDVYFSMLYAFHDAKEKLHAELEFMRETKSSGLITYQKDVSALDSEFLKKANAYHIPIVALNNDVGLTELTYHIIDLIIQDGITQIRTANLENLLCRDAAESDYHRQITELTGVLEPFSQSVFVRTKENIPLNSFRIASEDFLLPLFDGMLYFINGKNEQHLNEKRSAFVHKLRSSSTSYRLGIGSIHESDALKRTLQESLHAFSFADFLKKNSCHYADLREYRLLLQLNGSDCLREWRDVFYVPLQESDLNAKLDLLHLMELYVKKDGDYTSISNELFIHESTVRYRLNKIYEILGLHSSTQFYAEAKLAVYANWILQDSLLRRLK